MNPESKTENRIFYRFKPGARALGYNFGTVGFNTVISENGVNASA
jgi:hypothetical protein